MKTLMMVNIDHIEGYKIFEETLKSMHELIAGADYLELDPRKYVHIVSEFKHLMSSKAYEFFVNSFYKEFNELINEVANSCEENGNTPLHLASYSGDYLSCQFLIKLKSDPLAKNAQGKIPLDLAKSEYVRRVFSNLNKAAFEGDVHNIEYLVNCGNNINIRESIFGEAPIHQAIKNPSNNAKESLEAVLNCDAKINLCDCNGWTALHHSAQKGDLDTALVLIKKSANINAFSNSKKTPLHFACLYSHPEMVSLLIKNGSNIELQTDNNCVALHLAAKKGALECIKIILEHAKSIGKNNHIYSVDNKKWSALHYAAFHGNKEVVYFLLYWDADYNNLRNLKNSRNKNAYEILTDQEVKKYFKSISIIRYMELD